MIFMVFLWFHHENRLVGNFHYYIRNQRIKIRKYREFYGIQKVHLFRTVFLISFFLKNNGFRAKMCETLKIDLSICYNFLGKYFFPRSIFNDIK